MSDPNAQPRLIAERYQLRSTLGTGSMGTVWSAYDEFLQRPVAVKEVRLPAGFPEERAAELRERTLREARAIAVLAHPNVIVLHDVAREDGEPFVVMELLPGRSLAEIVRSRGPLSAAQAAAVADAVAAALQAAHSAGITHRDVKPGNVLIGAGGQIKLTDFGIARNVSEDTMTSTGVMLGSPAYIAPELASGAEVNSAADLWGLGATLFAAVEGGPPYDADDDPLETVGQVVHGDVPAPSPGPLAEVISGLMAKESTARMPLDEVRGRLFGLLDTPVQSLFDAHVLEHSTDTGLDRVDATTTQALTPVSDEQTPAGGEEPREPSGHPGSGALASDPGPLPFTPGSDTRKAGGTAGPARSRARRGPARTAALVVTSIVLFVLATAGGFAGARTLGGAAVLPQQQTVQASPEPSRSGSDLVRRTGDATNLEGVSGGTFSIAVPRDWTEFVTHRPGSVLPRSTLLQFVAPDGRRALTVRRFADYFSGHSMDQYLTVLRKRWPEGDFVLADKTAASNGEGELTITYRTVQRPGPNAADDESPVNRTTIARMLRRDSNLWILGITVPTDQEQGARSTLFDRIVGTFETTG